jgi:hypothetical protein
MSLESEMRRFASEMDRAELRVEEKGDRWEFVEVNPKP